MWQVKVWVWVIIYKWDKILLGKRKWSHWSWTWSFPGGHLDFWEPWEECANRETLEETWITIKNIEYFKTTNDVFTNENKHYITIYMKAEYDSWKVEIMEPEKCDIWDWFEIDNLPQPLFLPYDKLFN
jgi:8-oxo-dGTP diphosphatase